MTQPDWIRQRTAKKADDLPDARHAGEPPRVWAILEERAGDDAQVVNLVESLGWPYECKKPLYSLWEVAAHRLVGVIPDRQGREDLFSPPWPDLVVTIGGRSIVAAHRIKELSQGKTRLLCLGRPWGPLDWFDLVVTTPQYRLPALPNVLQNALPLNRPPKMADSEALRSWRSRIDELPRPHVAVLVGGGNGTYRFDRRAALDLAQRADAHVRSSGGSLLVATSPRTGGGATEALLSSIESPHLAYRWSGSGRDDNPYALFLEDADEVVVTGDSASMLADACATGAAVFLYQMPETRRTRLLNRLFASGADSARRAAWHARVERLVAKGWWTPRRDMGRIHEQLLARGRVARLGDRAPQRADVSELNTTLNRVRRLVHFGEVEALDGAGDVPVPR